MKAVGSEPVREDSRDSEKYASRFRKAKILCPKCGSEEDATLWLSVNARTDPDLKERLLNKRLQQHLCANCNMDIVMDEPLLYHDPDRKLMLCVWPEAAAGDVVPEPAALDQLAEELCGRDGSEDGYVRRLVPSYNRLLEKIHLADHGRDDCLMEIVKVAARKNAEVRVPDADVQELYYLTEAEEQMTFLVQGAEGAWSQMDLVTEAYRNAEQHLAGHLEQPDGWAVVDAGYAVDQINRLAGDVEPES